MIKVISVFGTRPEAIKMAPVVKALEACPSIDSLVCVTGQHRHLLDQVLELFKIEPTYDLDVMVPNQDLFHITSSCMLRLREVLDAERPDLVLVHGDTTTAFAASLAAYYKQVKVGHVEAGLRTYDKLSPYPEEMNRLLIDHMADFHFAPSAQAKDQLLCERIAEDTVYMTGNTVVDALLWVSGLSLEPAYLARLFRGRKLIFMTAHRRENHGRPLAQIFTAVRDFARENPDFVVVYPVHPNPNVAGVASQILGSLDNVFLIEPLNYSDCAYLLKHCHIVLTDSGGLQEEAPTFGKPILVLRDTSERPEVMASGSACLVGCDYELILTRLRELSSASSPLYQRMSTSMNPYGDGTAGAQIAAIIESHFQGLKWRRMA